MIISIHSFMDINEWLFYYRIMIIDSDFATTLSQLLSLSLKCPDGWAVIRWISASGCWSMNELFRSCAKKLNQCESATASKWMAKAWAKRKWVCNRSEVGISKLAVASRKCLSLILCDSLSPRPSNKKKKKIGRHWMSRLDIPGQFQVKRSEASPWVDYVYITTILGRQSIYGRLRNNIAIIGATNGNKLSK